MKVELLKSLEGVLLSETISEEQSFFISDREQMWVVGVTERLFYNSGRGWGGEREGARERERESEN